MHRPSPGTASTVHSPWQQHPGVGAQEADWKGLPSLSSPHLGVPWGAHGRGGVGGQGGEGRCLLGAARAARSRRAPLVL